MDVSTCISRFDFLVFLIFQTKIQIFEIFEKSYFFVNILLTLKTNVFGGSSHNLTPRDSERPSPSVWRNFDKIEIFGFSCNVENIIFSNNSTFTITKREKHVDTTDELHPTDPTCTPRDL